MDYRDREEELGAGKGKELCDEVYGNAASAMKIRSSNRIKNCEL